MEPLLEEHVYLARQGKLPWSKLAQILGSDLEAHPKLWIRSLAYSKLRECGYSISRGNLDLRVKRPSLPQNLELLILSEWDVISPLQLLDQIQRAIATRSCLGLGVVDDEWDVVFYELERFQPRAHNPPNLSGSYSGMLIDSRSALIFGSAPELEAYGMGNPASDSHGISIFEAAYLMERGCLRLRFGSRELSLEQLYEICPELSYRYDFYRDLTQRGYLLKSGLKFGANFRVYDRYPEPHSKYLLQILDPNQEMHIQQLARSVRLAHSVRKQLMLGFKHANQLCYLIVKRLKL